MKRLNLLVDNEIYGDLEYLTAEENLSKSELIRQSIKIYRRLFEARKREIERKEKLLKAAKTIENIRESTGVWDGVEQIRKFRDTRNK